MDLCREDGRKRRRRASYFSLFLALISFMVVEASGDGGGGKCIWYDHCGSLTSRGNLSCAYSGPPKPLTGDGLAALTEACPELVDEYISEDGQLDTCCSDEQAIALRQSTSLFKRFLLRCPACLRNMRIPFCYMTCSPRQSDFLEVAEKVPANFKGKEGKEMIKDIKFYMSKDFADKIYSSCQDVGNPSTNTRVISLFCGDWGAARCTGPRLFDYLGDFKENSYTPINIQYQYLKDPSETPENILPLNQTVQPCDKELGESLACSCADCHSSCPIIPDTWDAPGEPWIMFGYDGLAVAMALTAILFSITFLVIFAYCHKRNKRYTAVMVERSMRHPEEIRTAVGRRLANLSTPQAQYAGEDENSLLHGRPTTEMPEIVMHDELSLAER
ncbi:NPC intracellular cholesterol transporter 1-like, partial [Eriocheir sinensis]|uniref:NPC intracellular cholesterol transporter 1-like n=1 Tax=Eriocheir sinensis TaxID=95602 RepID=UPI0021C66339